VGYLGVRKEIWNKDLREIRVNKEATRHHAQKYRMGSVRLATGRIRTKEEFEQDKKRILSIKLP
jgi:hypothetical protein